MEAKESDRLVLILMLFRSTKPEPDFCETYLTAAANEARLAAVTIAE